MFKFLEFVDKARPKPFKRIQKIFNIESEWKSFKANLWSHKYKLLTLTILGSYPLYQNYLIKFGDKLSISFENRVKQTKSIAKVSEPFVQDIVTAVLRDPQIRREGGIFVDDLGKRQIVLDGVATLLVESVKDPVFVNQGKSFTKELAHNLLQDKTIRKDVSALAITLLRDEETRQEVAELLKWITAQKEFREAMAILCKDGFKDERMINATAQLFSGVLYEVLMDPEIVEKLKDFSFFILDSDGKRNQNIKGMIDTALLRLIGGTKRDSSDTSQMKISKKDGTDGEDNQDSSFAEDSEQDSDSKFFYF